MKEGNNVQSTNLNTASQKVLNDLRYAQNLSTTTGESHGFELVDSSTYRIYKVSTNENVNSPHHHAEMQEDLDTSFKSLTFEGDEFPSGNVEFNDFGVATSGGGTTIKLQDSEGNYKEISKKSRRIYRKKEDIEVDYKNGLGEYIVRTSKGVMSGQEA